MTKIKQAEKLISEMNQDEKAQLLQLVMHDLGYDFPGIESTPDICGGEARIVRTRILVWIIEQAKRIHYAIEIESLLTNKLIRINKPKLI